MTEFSRAYLAKADRALRSAHVAVEIEDADTAANRAYYACFYVAQAALVEAGDRPKTHAGTHRQFALRFVANGPVPRDVAETLPAAFRMRLRSDYDAMALSDLGAAADLVRDAERFVRVVSEIVR